jgi:hypothetical protein
VKQLAESLDDELDLCTLSEGLQTKMHAHQRYNRLSLAY